MVSSAKGHDKLASGIAYCIRCSKHLGCAETTQCLWKALHTLAADQHSFSKPALFLVQALDLQAGLQLPSSVDQAPAEVSPVTKIEIGTQTIEAVITESEWKLQTEQIVKMTVDMTVAQSKGTHGSSSRSSEAEPAIHACRHCFGGSLFSSCCSANSSGKAWNSL